MSGSLATLLQAQINLPYLLGCTVASVLEWSELELWPGTLCCVLGLDTLLSQCLSPPASHPEGSRNTPGCFMLQKPEIRADLMGHLAHMQTLPMVTCT